MAARLALLFLAVLAAPPFASVASAEPKIAVLPFTGPKADLSRAQVVDVLFGVKMACVPQAQVSKRGKPDFTQVRQRGVALVVTGVVKGKGAKAKLQLEVFDARGRRKLRESYGLARNGKLSSKQLDALAAKVE